MVVALGVTKVIRGSDGEGGAHVSRYARPSSR